ncbi:1-deoxy-D-xylulose-5-phosphate reductoisomerase [Zavarzinia sp. CC-PAN008]|uniref:1-deoxy-D-xylulose-5-phosphate reductoisomerase n=1 Tax=Zavarzinia sp. CC-PAN008 TaxID=3243332 RepID=UPI003F74860F
MSVTTIDSRPLPLTAPPDGRRSVTILGSTGSVGTSTVDLLLRNPDAFEVEALTAYGNLPLLVEQALALRPRLVVTGDASRYAELKERLAGTGIEVAAGSAAVVAAAARPSDWVMSAIVGAAGLQATLAAAHRGAIVALANKESLVCAGELMTAAVKAGGGVLLPVDSEHNAIFQCFDFDRVDAIEKLILTASGGPFRERSRDAMASVTPEQAVAHPNWSMGAKISVDSATMMNKGLELIEAHHLFPVGEARIEILVHPQSVIHSMVAYCDGSVLAQLGSPDMRTPIAYALGWPRRIHAPAPRLDLAALGKLTFEAPDPVRFPALDLARHALKAGGAKPVVLNAANEVAVAGFLSRRVGFLDIVRIVDETLDAMDHGPVGCLDDVLAADQEARRRAGDAVAACVR